MTVTEMRQSGLVVSELSDNVFNETGRTVPIEQMRVENLYRRLVGIAAAEQWLNNWRRETESEIARREAAAAAEY